MKTLVVILLFLPLITISSTQGSTLVSGDTTQIAGPTSGVSVNASWTFSGVTNVTSVCMNVTNLKSAQWAAIGIGLNDSMGENHVFMCKRLANDTIVINRYINPEKHHEPQHAGSEQGGVFTPGQQQFSEGVVVCQFTLSNFTTQTLEQLKAIQPLSQSTQYHPKFAVGLLNDDSEPKQHDKKSREPLTIFVRLNTTEIILFKTQSTDHSTENSGGESITFVRVHEIIMVFTWILAYYIRV